MSTLHPRIAASYARRATESDMPPSLADQHAVNARRATADGYIIPERYRFGEIGSGRDPDLPALQRLLHAASSGAFSRLYVTDLNRLSRSSDNSLDLTRRFDAAGVEVTVSGHRPEVTP